MLYGDHEGKQQSYTVHQFPEALWYLVTSHISIHHLLQKALPGTWAHKTSPTSAPTLPTSLFPRCRNQIKLVHFWSGWFGSFSCPSRQLSAPKADKVSSWTVLSRAHLETSLACNRCSIKMALTKEWINTHTILVKKRRQSYDRTCRKMKEPGLKPYWLQYLLFQSILDLLSALSDREYISHLLETTQHGLGPFSSPSSKNELYNHSEPMPSCGTLVLVTYLCAGLSL